MSTTSTTRPLADAIRDAHAFRDLFPKSTYTRWEIAGSVRRKRPEVGDVEHVIEPAFANREVGGGLFTEIQRINLLFAHLDTLVAGGTATKHQYGGTGYRWGEKYRGVDFCGFLHEIFCATAVNWGSTLLIRTGPADYSRMVVTKIKDGGMYRQQDGQLIYVATGEAVSVPTELRYCQFAVLPYIEPEARR